LVGIAIAIVVIVVASVVVTLALDHAETVYEPGMPEAAVQAYFRAIQDGDAEAAVALFTTDLQGYCSTEKLRRSYQYRDQFSIRIRETTERGGVTVIDVRIAVNGGNSPFGSGYDTDAMLVLEREDSEWRISDPPWPNWCPPKP
jgi:ketosteroid isomerase-like protein